MPLAERATHATKIKNYFFIEEICLKERVFLSDIASKREEKVRRGKSGEEIIPRGGYIPIERIWPQIVFFHIKINSRNILH
jgi:hypothetical protein